MRLLYICQSMAAKQYGSSEVTYVLVLVEDVEGLDGRHCSGGMARSLQGEGHTSLGCSANSPWQTILTYGSRCCRSLVHVSRFASSRQPSHVTSSGVCRAHSKQVSRESSFPIELYATGLPLSTQVTLTSQPSLLEARPTKAASTPLVQLISAIMSDNNLHTLRQPQKLQDTLAKQQQEYDDCTPCRLMGTSHPHLLSPPHASR